MKKRTLILLTLLLVTFSASCMRHDKYGTYQKDIDIIYVYHSGFGQKAPEYKIDLQEKKFSEYNTGIGANFVLRDETAENEGFTFVSDLDEDKIATFIRQSARNGFTGWQDKYDNLFIMDGHQWGIRITYADRTEKQIYGSNKYPPTYEDMAKAFYELTGKRVLYMNGQNE